MLIVLSGDQLSASILLVVRYLLDKSSVAIPSKATYVSLRFSFQGLNVCTVKIL